MSDIFISVTHHPSRSDMFSNLTDRISVDYVSKDSGDEGCWNVSKRAWGKAIKSGCDWGLVLQDDVRPIDNFEGTVNSITEAFEDRIICLSCMDSPRRRDAVDEGADWIAFRYSTWGQGILMPTGRAKQLLEWCDEYVPDEYGHYDTRLTWWLQELREPCYVPIPNLVEHRKCKSVMGHVGHRQSVCFKKDFSEPHKLTDNPNIIQVNGSPIDSRYDYTSLEK